MLAIIIGDKYGCVMRITKVGTNRIKLDLFFFGCAYFCIECMQMRVKITSDKNKDN